MRLSLKLFIPLLIIGTALVLVAYLFYINSLQLQHRLEEDVSNDLRVSMTHSQSTLEYLLRVGGLSQLQEEVTSMGSHPNMKFAALADERGKILTSIRIADRGQDFDDRILSSFISEKAIIENAIDAARKTMRGSVWLDADSTGVFALYPVNMPVGQALHGELKTGFLFAYRDIAKQRSKALAESAKNTISVFFPVLLIAILTSWLLHRIVTSRINKLIEATVELSEGRYVSKRLFSGRDEISKLYRAFDHMANKINVAQEALISNERHYRTLIESANAIPWELDTGTWRFTYVGPQAEEIFGYPIEQWYEESFWSDHILDEDRDDAVNFCINESRLGRDHEFEYRMRTADEKIIWVADSVNVISSENEAPILRGFMFDITERKKNEISLQHYREKLQELVAERTKDAENAKNEAIRANNAKSEFLSRMSHELRTPLNAVIGFSELLKMQLDESDNKRRQADQIFTAGQHLLTLIEEILDLSRIDTGNIEIKIQSLELEPLIKETVAFIQPQANQRAITIELSDCTGVMVKADPVRLKEVMLNLLSNAVKYNSENGVIRIACNSDNDNVVISISDTGEGLTDEKISQLFEPFSRLGAELTGVQGTGIGMTISKQLIELMHGSIDVVSVLKQGTTFNVTLPIA